MKRGKERAFVNLNGVPVMVQKDREYADDDPIVVKYPTLFEDVAAVAPEPAKRAGRRGGV